MTLRPLLIKFDDVACPVALFGCDKLPNWFEPIFRSWTFTEVSEIPEACSPKIKITKNSKGYYLKSPYLDGPRSVRHEVDIVCALIVALGGDYLHDHPEKLCFHGAAAEFNGRLVIFPNRYRAGKSLLSACMASMGIRVFADDILPVDASDDECSANGVATGVSPRLRLPLPDNLAGETQRFLKDRWGSASERYLYLDLSETELAQRGSTAPIGGFVLLEREEGAEVKITPLDDSEILHHAVRQNFARRKQAGDILKILRNLIAISPCFRLSYDRAEDAVALLKDTFSDWDVYAQERKEAQIEPPPNSREIVYYQADKTSDFYQQSPGVSVQAVDSEQFLADPKGVSIHRLNPTASRIWSLLTEPTTKADVKEILGAAFPDVEKAQIERDVSKLVKSLSRKQLIRRVNPSLAET